MVFGYGDVLYFVDVIVEWFGLEVFMVYEMLSVYIKRGV